MTTEQILGLIFAWILMAAGLAGSILPGLPSTPLVLISAVAHKLYFGPAGADWWVLIVLTLMTVASLALDYIASVYGARRLGATWRGAIGAIIGGLIGLFFNLPGILLGPFLGAMLFEMAGGREWRDASRAGVGATLGLLAGAIGKIACCLAMIALFSVNVILRSLHPTAGLQ